MAETFGIQIDSNEIVSDLAVVENKKSADLYEWQRNAIKYFFENNCKCVFNVATGCLTGDTLIEMPRNIEKYNKGIPIKQLVGQKNFYVYTFNIEKQCIELNKVKNVWCTGIKDVYEIKTKSGKIIKATFEHPFLVNVFNKHNSNENFNHRVIKERKYIEVKDLKIGDELVLFNRSLVALQNKNYSNEINIDYTGKIRKIREHRFICEQIYRKLTPFEIIHHKDGNHNNNEINNLEIMDSKLHNSMHTKERGFYGKLLWEKQGHPKGFKGKKHTSEEKKIISINTKASLNKIPFDIYRKDTHSKEFTLYGFNSVLYKTNKQESIEKFKQTAKTKCFIEKKQKISSKETRRTSKIISIKYVGKEEVYNMEVENNHNFIANNFIVHNCGKTFLAMNIIKKILENDPKCRVLIVVPKNVIMETGWYQEFYNNGFNLQDIGVYYGNIKEICKITITNMQNIQNICMEMFNCRIFDEIHNYSTNRLLPYLEDDCKYKIGLSATIEHPDGKHWSILKAFDYTLFKYMADAAINDGVLNQFNFTNIAVELDDKTYNEYAEITQNLKLLMSVGGGYNKIMRKNDSFKMKMLSLLNKRKQLVNNYPRKFNVVTEIVKKHKKDKIIIFSQFNEQTNKYYWHLLEIGVKAQIIHSDIDKEKINSIMTNVKHSDTFCIVTSKMLDEGWNLPKLDVAIITAGDSTDKQTIQRMGRVLRKKDKPSNLYQVYCSDTIEETYGINRAKMFRDLCTDYRDYIFWNENESFILDDSQHI